jgi:hypothetical protein
LRCYIESFVHTAFCTAGIHTPHCLTTDSDILFPVCRLLLIEQAAISEHPLVSTACVMTEGAEGSMDKKLVAYVVRNRTTAH